MDAKIKSAIEKAVLRETFAQELKMELVALDEGYSVIKMPYLPSKMDNIYARAHGGAIFGLIDEAFETSAQTQGTIAVALNVNVTYVSSPKVGDVLRAESNKISSTKKTASYDIKVTNQDGEIIANCQALAYQTGKPIPFLE